MLNVPEFLKEHQQDLQLCDPSQQTILYRKDSWEKRLNKDPDFTSIVDCYPCKISRKNLFELARAAKNNTACIRKLFIAVMIWGKGDTDNRGPCQTLQALNDLNSSSMLQSTFTLIREGKIVQAYKEFKLRSVKSPFFTKYFYFIGETCDLKIKPLILDSVVNQAFKDLLKLDIRKKDYGRNEAERYQRYIEQVNGWASALKCRPDSIEYFLFSKQRNEV